jgi:hypothetical protein
MQVAMTRAAVLCLQTGPARWDDWKAAVRRAIEDNARVHALAESLECGD